MQIREQGRRIQCIRATYKPTSKKCEQKMVASFETWHTTPPQDALDALTPDEQQELTDYMNKREEQRKTEWRRGMISSGATYIMTITEALEAGEAIADAQADAIWHEMARLTKALKKTGHAKPKRARKAVGTDTKSGDIFTGAAAAGGTPT